MMSKENRLAAESVMEAQKEVARICKPLLATTPIVRVGYWEIDAEGNYISLSNCNHLQLWMDEGLYRRGERLFNTICHAGFTIQDLPENYEEFRRNHEEFIRVSGQLGQGHECLYVLPNDSSRSDQLRVLILLGAFDNPGINTFYLNNTNALKYFGRYFLKEIRELSKRIVPFRPSGDKAHAAPPALEPLELPIPEFLYSFCPKTQLSPRQREIIGWYICGKTQEETAQIMGISPNTIDVQLSRMKEKLDCRSKTQMVVELLKDGLCLEDFLERGT